MLTEAQKTMPMNFTKMNIGELAQALSLINTMFEKAPKNEGNYKLLDPHAQLTVPLMFLARTAGAQYHRSIEVGKIKKVLGEISEVIEAMKAFAIIMYPAENTPLKAVAKA